MFVKNIICFLGGLLIISNTFAACVETTYTLKKGGNSAYDDYLQPSTAKYEKRSGFCIEPQFFPNAINVDNFAEKGVLKSGEKYAREIIYSFEN